MAFYWTMFTTAATRTIGFDGKFNCLAQLPILAPWHVTIALLEVLQPSGFEYYFLLNQGISFRLRGILRVFPFLPSLDLEDLTLFPPSGLTVFSATFRPDAVAFEAAALAAPLALVAAFLAVDFAFETALVAVAFAGDFLVAGFFEVAFLVTAAINFFEIIALIPALTNPFCPALEMPAEDFIPASLSFFAVAFPTPGSAISAASGSFFGLAAMSSPTSPKETVGHNPCLN
jgi:hypothetical protein